MNKPDLDRVEQPERLSYIHPESRKFEVFGRPKTRHPIQLEFSKEGLLLRLYLVLNQRAATELRGQSLWSLARAGIERVWQRDFLLSPELEEAFLNFVQRQQPADLSSAVLYLDERVKLALDEAKALGQAEVLPKLPLRLELKVAGPTASPTLHLIKSIVTGQRRAVRMYFTPLEIFPSHVGSALWRRFWGIFRYGHLETMGFNWSPAAPGYIVLNSKLNEGRIGRVAAHELGHILGLGDAYAAPYRFFYEHPGSENYLMNSNGELAEEEFIMFLRAHTVNKAQFFPWRFSWARVKSGAKEEANYYRRKAKAAKIQRQAQRAKRRARRNQPADLDRRPDKEAPSEQVEKL
ncbi:MAG: hypothetical protein Q4P08_02830 [Eubacteriales bacterium]|nr:hypothetical protein [Eubacteriales bacterium]